MLTFLKSAIPTVLADEVAVRDLVHTILTEVERRGIEAVREFSTRHDRWNPSSFELTTQQVDECLRMLPKQALEDLKLAREQICRFAEAQKSTLGDVECETLPGVVLGHRQIPVARVGCYVPGGAYPLVASALMSIATARVAGVKRVIACTPPLGGRVNVASVAAIALAGADRVFCVGGAQAIAAMAFGAEGFETVDMIVGPGNAYVTEAKRQLYGRVGIDLLAGPTEVLIIADRTADADLCAVDLLGQAEHGPTSRVALLTTAADLAQSVIARVEALLKCTHGTGGAAEAWREHSQVIVCDNDAELIDQANRLAFEHVQIMTSQPANVLSRLVNYGSAFLGTHANVAFGDKIIGTNHILPTRGAARYTGGLWVGSFLKTCTYQNVLTAEASTRLAEVCSRICALEGLPAHKEQADFRLRRYLAHSAIGGCSA